MRGCGRPLTSYVLPVLGNSRRLLEKNIFILEKVKNITAHVAHPAHGVRPTPISGEVDRSSGGAVGSIIRSWRLPIMRRTKACKTGPRIDAIL